MSLRVWQETFQSIFDSLTEAVLVVDRKRRLRYWNRGAEHFAGHCSLRKGWPLPCRELQLCGPEDGSSACESACPVACTLADGRPREAPIYLRDASHRRIPGRLQTSALRNREGTIIGAVASVSETTTSSWALSRISELEERANLDPLTGVANRRFTELQLRRSLAELVRFQWRFGVVVLDVDDLKSVNDIHGHRAGDNVLRMVARTLSGNSRPFDVVGRWGGDEFLAVIKNVDEGQLEFVARKLSAACEREAVPLENEEALHVRVSAGVAVAGPEDTVDTLVARGDRHMYERKSDARRRAAS